MGEDLDSASVRVGRERVVVAGDRRVGVVGGRERDEVVIVGIAARRRVRCGRVAVQRGLAGEVGDEPKRFVGRDVFA